MIHLDRSLSHPWDLGRHQFTPQPLDLLLDFQFHPLFSQQTQQCVGLMSYLGILVYCSGS